MSARTAIAALLIGAVVVGAGALAYIALSPPPEAPEAGGPEGGKPPAVASGAGEPAVAPPTRRDSDAAPAPADGAPWLEFAGYEPALQAIHWDDVGTAYAELVPLLEARFRAITRDSEPSEGVQQRIDELWGTLDVLAAPMRERVPYVWGNGVFTHPAYVANSLPATLHQLGRGLTPEQLVRLRAVIGDALASEDYIENLEHDPILIGTMRAMCEAEARRGLSDAVNSVLTERQNSALHPRAVAGRVGLDPFHAVEMFRGKLIVLQFDDAETGARKLAELIAAEVPTNDVRIAEAALFAVGFIEMGYRECFPEGARGVDVAGHIDIERTFIVARRSGELMTNLVLLLAGGVMPVIPPEVLDRPIIMIRAAND